MKIESCIRCLALLFVLGALFPSMAHGQRQYIVGGSGTATSYTDEKYFAQLPWGMRSHWIQPWRSYMDTWSTSRLRDAFGIVWAFQLKGSYADALCKHLAEHGVKKLRVEYSWGFVDYNDPHKLVNQADFDQVIGACKKYHLRPLFLLNAHHGLPTPAKQLRVRLTQPASVGDRVVHIDPSDTANLVVGRSGLTNVSRNGFAAEAIATSIQPDGTVTLSKPIGKDLPAGPVPATVLKYLPFYPARVNGVEPPEFQETMRGWLTYVKTVGDNAKRVLGTDGEPDAGFDMEIWNELSFGSNFLTINKYFEQPVVAENRPGESLQSTTEEIARQTVAFVRDPANGFPKVGLGNGFTNQTPFGAGSTSPPGLSALDKHPYPGPKPFITGQGQPTPSQPVNALGEPDGVKESNGWIDKFVPTYMSYFPEYALTSIQTETLTRDIAPFTTDIYNTAHGRETHGKYSDGRPAEPPTMWITEVNYGPALEKPEQITQFSPLGTPAAPTVSGADAEHIKAKTALRFLTAYVNKGVNRIYFFCVRENNPLGLGLVSNELMKQVEAGTFTSSSDDSGLTSPAMAALHNLVTHMDGDLPQNEVHSITLTKVEEPDSRIQFEGDPTTANDRPNPHPPLYNRDVVAFLPFQATAKKYIVPVYVMTRNEMQIYKPEAPASDVTRFDMPDETFQLTIRGVLGGKASVSLYDPMTDKTIPATVVRDGSREMTVEVKLTDSPRLLVIQQ